MKRPEPSPSRNQAEAALDWAVRHGAARRVTAEVERQLRLRQRRRRSLAGGAAALLLCAVLVSPQLDRSPDAPLPAPPPALTNAVVSTPAKRTLPDGTVAELKDGAQITFDYSGPLRRVTLQRGEAHFTVMKDSQRPFVVEASGVEVRAVGTAFSVQRGASTVEVIVTEGRVAVVPERSDPTAATAPGAETLVDSGNRCIVDLQPQAEAAIAPQVEAVGQRELAERLGWRVPRLEFSGTPLAQVIPLLNQHAGVTLVLRDASLGTLELSGVVRADNTDSLLHLLQVEFGIEARRSGNEIHLHRPAR